MHRLNIELDQQGEAPACVPFASATASLAEQGLIVSHAERRVHPDPANECGPDAPRRSFEYRRLIDVLASSGLIVLLAPLMLAITLLIVLSAPGAPVFLHRRLGRDGKIFPCLKFRSMCVNAEARLEQLLASDPGLRQEWQNGHKLEHDPRVTRIGHVLRITSLDELPQLFNVLWGQMTLVGPRPIVASELHHYGRFAAYYFRVKPGLTGLWQVSGRSSTSYRRRVAADVLYVRSRSFLLDSRILMGTVPAVLTGKGSC